MILSYSGYGQKDILFNERVKGQVLDTIEFFANSVVIHTLWLNDTIQVDVQNKTLKFDSKKGDQNKKQFLNLSERKKYIDNLKTQGQNCYSYALERYLAGNGMGQQTVFNRRSLISIETFNQIIKHYFKEVKSFNALAKQNFKLKIPNNSLITFSNQAKKIIHGVYYKNERFYTKSMGNHASEFTKLETYIKEHYRECHMIKIYQFDESRINLAKLN